MATSIGGRHFQLKEQLWLAEKVFQYGGFHRGLPFAIKRTILIGCTGGHFRGAYWTQKNHRKVDSESTLRCTLNADLIYHNPAVTSYEPQRSWYNEVSLCVYIAQKTFYANIISMELDVWSLVKSICCQLVSGMVEGNLSSMGLVRFAWKSVKYGVWWL